VDVDHNLNTAINKIREALGDSSESPRFVETLPRRGYRFIGSLEYSGDTPASEEEQAISFKPKVSIQQRYWAAGILIVAAPILVVAFFRLMTPLPPRVLSATQLSSRPKQSVATMDHGSTSSKRSANGGLYRVRRWGEISPVATFRECLAHDALPRFEP
jgi:hypothetical protein